MILKYPHINWKKENGKINNNYKRALPILEIKCDKCNKIFIEKEKVLNKRIKLINKEICGGCSRPHMSSIAGLRSAYDEVGNLKKNNGRFTTEKWDNLTPEQQMTQVKRANKALHDKINSDPVYKQKHYEKVFKNSKIGYVSKAQQEIYEILKDDGYELDGSIYNMKIDIINKTKKIAIEYNGDYWHCNPRTWNKDDFNKAINMTASEKWNLDRRRLFTLRNLGYDVHVIWETTWNTDRNKVYDLLRKITNINYKFKPWEYKIKGCIKGKTYEEIYGVELAKIKKDNMSKSKKGKKYNTSHMWEIITPHQGTYYTRRLCEWRKIIKNSYSKLIKYNKIKYSDKYKIWNGTAINLNLLIKCPHCEMISKSYTNMSRYHFNNCKNKK